MTQTDTMKAVIIKDAFNIKVEDRPMPKIEKDKDVILKVTAAGLCGSDLHYYRGHQPPPYDFIIGHEVVGRVTEVGKGVTKFKVGDKVISPFTTSCGTCFYCSRGYTARCTQSALYGCPALSGAQAEYVRVPDGETSLFEIPDDIPEELLVLLCDILPTGYMTALNARRLVAENPSTESEPYKKEGVCVVIGCGPVGLCAITAATTMFEKVFATDIAPQRLENARKHGATALSADELDAAVKEATSGRGADAVLEVVGHEGALITAMKLARPAGVISSCGVHTDKEVKLPGPMLYAKNLRFQFGRCSVATFFPGALELLRANQDLFSKFIEHKIDFSQAEEYYKLFEANKVGKTVFVLKE